jgi:hypothetical protein
LIFEKKIGKNRNYKLSNEKELERMNFCAEMWDYDLKSLKESLEDQSKKKLGNDYNIFDDDKVC